MSPGGPVPPPVRVSGGIGSIGVDADGLRAAAPTYVRLGAEVDELARSCDLGYWTLWSAPPGDPGAPLLTEAHALLTEARATLTAAAAGLRAVGSELARAAEAYSAAEGSVVTRVTGWFSDLWHDDLAPALHGLSGLPDAVALGAAITWGTHSVGKGVQALLLQDPQLLDTVGLLGEGQLADPRLLAALLAGEAALPSLYPDGHPVVTAAGVDTAAAAIAPPRSLAGLVEGLSWRDGHEDETSTTAGGEIDVKFLHHADGTRSVIVDIPGTKTWNGPGRDGDVADFGTNLRAVQGRPNSYEKGVLEAMARAGVRPDDDVLLAGHSLGGMIAVQVAAAAAKSKRFTVTHVLTAGSPVGRTVGRLPASIQVLSLENSKDLVPEADARANPVRPNVTTVRVPEQAWSVGGNHGLDGSYAAAVRRAEADAGPSLRFVEAGASRYLDADSVTSRRFVITRSFD